MEEKPIKIVRSNILLSHNYNSTKRICGVVDHLTLKQKIKAILSLDFDLDINKMNFNNRGLESG